MWHRLASFIIKFRVALLLSLLILTGIAGFVATKVQLSYDFTSAIPTDNPKYVAYQKFRSQFGEDGNLMVIGVQTKQFFEDGFFNDYASLVASLEKINGVENVIAVPTAITLIKDTTTNKLKVQKIAESTPNVNAFQRSFENLPFYQGLLYNPKTHSYLMGIHINKGVLNSKNRDGVVNEISAACNDFAQLHKINFHYSGLPFIRTQMATRVSAEMKLFLLLSFVLTAGILALFFRSFSTVIASVLVVATGVTWSLATIVLLGYKITLLTALIPPLIVVIGIPNCVYLLNKYHAEYHRHGNKMKALLRSVDRMGIVTFFTNLTAAIGFGVFFFTKSAILKEFGLVAGINILAVFIVSLIFIPALFSFLPPPRVAQTRYLENNFINRLLETLVNWVFHHRPLIYAATLLISAVSLWGVFRLHSEAHIVDDLPKHDVVYKDLQFFEKNFGGVMPLEIVVDTRKKNGAVSLPVMEKIDALSREMQAYPAIGHILSITEGVKFARQAYYDGDSTSYGLPNMFDGAFIQPYLRSKNTGGNNMFGRLLNSFIDSTKQQTRVSVQMADVGSKKLPELLEKIIPATNKLFDSSRYDVTFTGTSIVFLEGSRFIINSLRDSISLAFLMIFGCMLLLFRSWKILLISMVTNLVPLLITAGIMGWAGIAIKPSTVLVFSIALGITIDVTIRFLVNFKQELLLHDQDIAATVKQTIQDTGLSIIYTSFILIAGFGVFMLSAFDGTKALGYLTSLTLFLAMIFNLTLQPALLLWIDKAKQKKAGHTFITETTERL